MMQHRFKLMRTCKESQALIMAKEDFALAWHERLALRSHLMICEACTKVNANVSLLRGQLGRWRAYEERD
jgi:hypothetical protein